CEMRPTKAAVAVAMPDRWPRKLSATRSAPRMALALPEIVISLAPRVAGSPSRACGVIAMSGSRRRNAVTTSGNPAITPAWRATTSARPARSSGMVAVEVMSPARPRSSSSARVTAASTSSGETKASARWSDVANVEVAVDAGGMGTKSGAKSIVTAVDYGTHPDRPQPGLTVLLRSSCAPLQQRDSHALSAHRIVIFVWATYILLCCAAFRIVEHYPEKWIPVFEKDHAQITCPGRHERHFQNTFELADAGFC